MSFSHTLITMENYKPLQQAVQLIEPSDNKKPLFCTKWTSIRHFPLFICTVRLCLVALSSAVDTGSCQFYLAESSIPNAGFGIYTVKSIKKGQHIEPFPNAPSIVVTDVDKHNQGHEPNWNHINYVWAGEGWADFESNSVSESVPTFGSLSNFHTYLYNIKPIAAPYNDAMSPRDSPGLGAYSYYEGYMFQAAKDIEPGDEIFAHYGETWFDGRPSLASAPLEKDFLVAHDIVTSVAKDLGPNATDSVLKMIKEIVRSFRHRTASIIPTTNHDFIAALPSNTTQDAVKNFAKTSVTPRTMEWITSQGVCLDNIVPALSTVPHAGRGAFAQRFIPKGSVIVPAPLLQVPDFQELFMYNLKTSTEGFMPRTLHFDDAIRSKSKEQGDEQLIGSQLLMNYCFSHFETPLLLCPQTNAILVNHCSTRESYGGDCARYNADPDESKRGPNAEIRWATTWDPDTAQWLQYSLKDIETLTRDGKRGLSIDYVAIRDIYPGDEIFIDYGEDWEKLWEIHLSEWIPPVSLNHIPVKEMNDNTELLKTPDELSVHPYPENVLLGCIYWTEEGELYDSSTGPRTVTDWSYNGGGDYTFENNLEAWHWPCQVIDRNTSNNTYTVQIFQSPASSDTEWNYLGAERIIRNYPRSSIHFFPKKRSSDQHLLGAFRHPIGLPDHMVPFSWKFDRSLK